MKKSELKETRQFKYASNKQLYLNNFPLYWCVKFDLSVLDVIVFCIVRDATEKQQFKAYTGSVKGICSKTNTSLATIRKTLDKLYERGFIERKKINRDGKKVVAYCSNVSTHEDANNTIDEQLSTALTKRRVFNGTLRDFEEID